MSPDWSAKEEPVPYAKLNDPQTLNLYAYVQNNPMTGVDPDGHCGDNDALCQGLNAGFDALHGNTNSEAIHQLQQSLARNDQQLQAAQQQLAQQQSGQQQYDHDPKAHVADIGPGSEIYKRTHGEMKNGQIGSGECVAACTHFANLPGSNLLKAGPAVMDKPNLEPGTAIATFNSNGRYPQTDVPKNSAIYLGRGARGSIWILDQWNPGHPPTPREVLPSGSFPSNNPNGYSVIYLK